MVNVMNWTEVIKNYPIIQTYYKKKIAAKRRMKASQGLDETLNDRDMSQLSDDIIKTMKDNLPTTVNKPLNYNDVVAGLKEGETAKLLGFRPQDLNVKYNDTKVPYEVKPVQEPVTEEVEPPIEEETVVESIEASPENIGETGIVETVEEVPVEPLPPVIPAEPPPPVIPVEPPPPVIPVEPPPSQEVNIAAEVSKIGEDIGKEFKPITPINAPLPYQTPYGQPNKVVNPRPQSPPQASESWFGRIDFWR
jgi:hypothetical protein